ncbi:M23 family metallopeptidase [Roseofilum sp. Guam]|uniref:M23 family metallopeptidase n=1 Tax=Roseofilum sp. Guam TaxID=2821502 RepID=UPI001B0536E7|nr:M23 family metallopeptidase [Roseofilum sp. Guam]MBP0031246.1 M23 family metallopeptidase [Roseofilum sp. Guam]
MKLLRLNRVSTILLMVVGVILFTSCSLLNGNSQAQTQTWPKFAQPIQCSLGEDCYILRYVDRDPGPGYVDVGCGRMTDDGHSGTDFGIPDEWAMQQGVPVLAAAPGRVLRVRDGIEDRRITSPADLEAIEGINCGNGMVIDHGQGWETQYCHLRQGSVAVQPGTEVQTGTVLGMVGSSGESSFPHVHLTVRYQGNVVDPFVGPEAEPGCNVSGTSLWSTDIEYQPTGLIRAGFATEVPDLDRVWSGEFRDGLLSVQGEALVFWVHGFGVLQGDEERLRLIDPQGQVVSEGTRVRDRPNRIILAYSGKKNTRDRPLIPGTWRGEYQLKRGDKTLMNVTKTIELE